MSRFDGQYLTLEQAALLYPLYKEIKWIEDLEINGGALHIVVEDGNYEDGSIKWCIDHIKSGNYKRENDELDYPIDLTPEDIQRQLDIAEALMQLTEEQREMVCGGFTHTEYVFNALHNVNWEGYPMPDDYDYRNSPNMKVTK